MVEKPGMIIIQVQLKRTEVTIETIIDSIKEKITDLGNLSQKIKSHNYDSNKTENYKIVNLNKLSLFKVLKIISTKKYRE